MLRNILHLSIKEFIQLWRDRRTLIFLLLTPTLLTILFGYAVGTPKATAIPTRVIDLDHGQIADEYIKDISDNETFALDVRRHAESSDLEQAEQDLKKDKLKAIIVLPHDLTSSLLEGGRGQVTGIVDGSDTFSAPTILRELGAVAVKNNLKLAAGYLLYEGIVKTQAQAALRVAPVELKTDIRYNPELKSQNFTIPGIIGLILQLLTIIIMATSIARERERGTMEQLAVTPLTSSEIFIGKLVPYFILAIIDTINALVVAWLLFHVQLAGHYAVVTVIILMFILGSLGIGQLISVLSKNQNQAIQIAIFYIFPVVILSGAFNPIETLPTNVRPFTYLFPLTYFCRSVRASLLREASFYDVKYDLLALLAFVIATFGLSVFFLRRQATKG